MGWLSRKKRALSFFADVSDVLDSAIDVIEDVTEIIYTSRKLRKMAASDVRIIAAGMKIDYKNKRTAIKDILALVK